MPIIVPKTTKPKLIDFIGIGAVKSGTTWVVANLRKNQNIFIPEKKEIYYFGNEKNGGFYDKGIDWYNNHFLKGSNEQLFGEFTTHYMFLEESPDLIYKYNPNIKLLICLRNPIDMIYSYYWWRKANFNSSTIPVSFEEDFETNPEYLNRGMYYKQLKRFFELFPKENIHMILFDDIKKHPESVLKGIHDFLDLSVKDLPADLSVPVNEAKAVRFKFLARFGNFCYETLKNAGLKNVARTIICYSPITVVYAFINKRKFRYDPMKSSTRKKLKKIFRDDINELSILLEKDLSVWN